MIPSICCCAFVNSLSTGISFSSSSVTPFTMFHSALYVFVSVIIEAGVAGFHLLNV